MLEKENPELNWPRIYFLILLFNAVLVLFFYFLGTYFNQQHI